MAPVLTAVTDHVHLAQTPLVNWTLVADQNGVVLIDAGFPGSRDDVVTSLGMLGFAPPDLTAILLTHAHIDHLGSAIWFAAEHGTPVYCHADEVAHARREYLQQVSPVALLARAWRPTWLRWSLQVAQMGGLVRAGIPTARGLTDDVAAALVRKLGNRVPAVLAGETITLEDQLAQWEQRKALEATPSDGARRSCVDGVPTAQPALALAQKVIDRVLAAGLPADLIPPAVSEVRLRPGADAENDLRTAVLRFMESVRGAEQAVAAQRGRDPGAGGPISAEEWRDVLGGP